MQKDLSKCIDLNNGSVFLPYKIDLLFLFCVGYKEMMKSVRVILHGKLFLVLEHRIWNSDAVRAGCPAKSLKAAEDFLGKKHVRAGRNLEIMKLCLFTLGETPPWVLWICWDQSQAGEWVLCLAYLPRVNSVSTARSVEAGRHLGNTILEEVSSLVWSW